MLPLLFTAAWLTLATIGLLLLAAAALEGRRTEGIALWGGALVAGALGLALLELDLRVPGRSPTAHVFGLALLVGATAVSWTASRTFQHRAAMPWAALAGALGVAALGAAGSPDGLLVAATCLAGAAYTVAAGSELARPPPTAGGGGAVGRAAVVLQGLHGLLYLLRGAFALRDPMAADGGVVPDWVPPAMLLEALVHAVGTAFLLLLLAKQRAERARLRAMHAAHAAAQAASEAKSRFLALMSHALRTPLNGVLGMAQALAADPQLPAEARERAALLQRGGRQLLGIVNDALDLALIEARRLPLDAAPAALAPLLGDCVAALDPADAGRLEVEMAADAPGTVVVDPARLRQILGALLLRAAAAAPDGPLGLRAAAIPGGVRIEVVDAGPTVPAALREMLFIPFRPGGSGLGLALAAALARSMQGEIGYGPGSDGRGNRVWVDLPQPAPVAHRETVAAG